MTTVKFHDVAQYATPMSSIHPKSESQEGTWTFLTNHSHVLICLARDPEMRLRDVAQVVGITERAAQRIVADLERAGALTRSRDGRRNHYEVNVDHPLHHPLEAHRTVGDLIRAVGAGGPAGG